MRFIVILFLLSILFSLGSALFYLIRDKGSNPRTVKALTIRVALSVSLFFILLIGFKMGWIQNKL